MPSRDNHSKIGRTHNLHTRTPRNGLILGINMNKTAFPQPNRSGIHLGGSRCFFWDEGRGTCFGVSYHLPKFGCPKVELVTHSIGVSECVFVGDAIATEISKKSHIYWKEIL